MVVVCVETYLAAGILPALVVGAFADGDSVTADIPTSVSTLQR